MVRRVYCYGYHGIRRAKRRLINRSFSFDAEGVTRESTHGHYLKIGIYISTECIAACARIYLLVVVPMQNNPAPRLTSSERERMVIIYL